MNSSAFCGISCWVIMFSTGVGTGSGWTVLMDPNASPSKPSPVPWANEELSLLASSIDWFSTLKPPRTSVSVPTSPLAELPSPVKAEYRSALSKAPKLARSRTVRDLPGAAFGLVEASRLGRIENGVAGRRRLGRSWEFGAPDPKVGRPGIKVQVQVLCWRANADGGEVEGVVLDILGLQAVSQHPTSNRCSRLTGTSPVWPLASFLASTCPWTRALPPIQMDQHQAQAIEGGNV